MAAILKAMDTVLHIPLDDAKKEVKIDNIRDNLSKYFKIIFLSKNDKALIMKVIENGEENQPFTDAVANSLVHLWGDKGVKKAYDMRSEYQLNDSAK